MHPDVQSLLALQQDDLQIYALEAQLQELAPRLTALEKERGKIADALERARKSVEAEESRQREARGRIETHKQLAERSQRQYESVTSPREATAALAQLEQTRRMVEESERDAEAVQARIDQGRHQVAELEGQLEALESRQSEARASLGADHDRIQGEIAEAQRKREGLATAVPQRLRAAYEKVRSRRRTEIVFPLRGASCSACDTAIPTQRRASMAASGALEMCEGCGMLLYAGE